MCVYVCVCAVWACACVYVSECVRACMCDDSRKKHILIFMFLFFYIYLISFI